MSGVAFTQTAADPGGVLLTWGALGNGQAGAPTPAPSSIPWQTASFEATGTFGAAGSVQIEGSNDGVNFYKLSPAALTAAGIFASLSTMEKPRFLRPNCTAGDGTTAIVVTAYLRL